MLFFEPQKIILSSLKIKVTFFYKTKKKQIVTFFVKGKEYYYLN